MIVADTVCTCSSIIPMCFPKQMVYLSYRSNSSYSPIQVCVFPLDNDEYLATCSASLKTVSWWELLTRQSRVGRGVRAASILWGLAGETEVLTNINKVRGARGLLTFSIEGPGCSFTIWMGMNTCVNTSSLEHKPAYVLPRERRHLEHLPLHPGCY